MEIHQLALPLPAGYNNYQEGEYAVFQTDSGDSKLPPQVERYLDNLCAFMKETKLIQRHPDDFFDFVEDSFLESSRHTDGTSITSDEREHTAKLCSSVGSLLDLQNLQHDMRELIKNGPPATMTNIYAFYMKTKDLLLNRSRRPNNDSVSLTLRTSHEKNMENMKSGKKEEPDKERKRRILELVMSRRMNQKKKHEVEIMSHSIADLVTCCRRKEDQLEVRTVINIGEGKGYVSRSLSMVHNLQVVGLDCNPAHKAEAMEHTEKLLLSSFNNDAVDNNTETGPLNLMYEPRGHLASIVCRVHDKIEWKSLLTGYVHLCNTEGKPIGNLTDTLQEDEEEEDEWIGVAEVVATDMRESKIRGQKLKCKVEGCKRILRRSFAALSRHAHQHLKDKSCTLDFTTRDEIHQWNTTLPAETFSQKLVETFFEPVDWSKNDAKDAEDLDDTNTNSADGSASEHDALQFVYFPRGYRAKVLFFPRNFNDTTVGKDRSDLLSDGMRECTLTVLGFNEASNAHQIVFDGRKEKFHTTLVQLRDSNSAFVDSSVLHPSTINLLASNKYALVITSLQPTKASKPVVQVPDLRNTVMVGLHPCGDLGSNICRLFSSSGSRGLLLVSCCWHALTTAGFPLSRALQRRELSIQQVSLMLATQPFDMWANIDSNGQRDSAKLLFYRSLLKLFWRKMEQQWNSSSGERKAGCSCSCPFAPIPHLEPGFLRRMAQKKHHLTFSEFVHAVLEFYIFENTMRKSEYTWDKIVCDLCRPLQQAHFQRQLQDERDKALEIELSPKHFPSFLGLTVLRMWMCHTVESLFLMDRTLYLYESSFSENRSALTNVAVSLIPLFDGKISPRMYGICVRRF